MKTTGDFTVVGFAKGLYSDTTVKLKYRHRFKQFVQYPDLPKSIQNIIIDSKIINETGILNDTYINLDKLSLE
jgi:hypothetical protein